MPERSVVYRLRADVTQFRAQMAAASASVRDAGDKMTASGRDGEKFRRGLDQLGGTAGKIGLVAAGGLAAAVVAASNFDHAMSSVQAATHESTRNMELLREAAIKAGADTAYSASEAASAIEELAKAGVSTKDILAGGLQGALDLAAAGGQSVADAAETAATAMTQFGRAGTEVPHIADLLAAAAGKAQGEVSDMAMALKQSGTVASQLGLSLEETTGALAALGSQGLLGSDAGTSLKTFLMRLVPSSEEAADLMDQIGFNAFDAQGNLKSLTEIVANLQASFGDLTVAQRQANFNTIFGQDAIRAANILYSQGAAGIGDWIDKVNDSGFAAETASIKLDNLKGDLEQFRGSLETALIETGEGSQGPLRGVVQTLTGVVNAYGGLPSAAKNATSGMLAATAILGGSAFLGTKVIGSISATRVALQQLGVQATTTRRLLTGVGKGIAYAGILMSLGLIDDAVDHLFNRDLDTSNLGRSLDALSKRGSVTGTLADVFGDNLDGLNADLNSLDSTMEKIGGGWWDKFLPGDWSQSEQARNNIKLIDEALAGMVESGDVAFAEQTFARLADKVREGGNSVSQLTGLLEQYKIAMENAGQATSVNTILGDGFEALTTIGGTVAGVITRHTSATRDNTAANEDNAQSFTDVMKAMKAARDQRLAALNAEVGYQAAIDDANAAIKENGRTATENHKKLDLTTEKGRANATALYAVADGWNALSRRMKNAPGAFKAARENFIDLAEKMGLDHDAAKALAKQILQLPSKKVHVDADTGPAARKITALQRLINNLRDKHITITADYEGRGFNVHKDGHLGGKLLAGGNTFASGGYLTGPGGPTSDSIPIWASNGEYVVNAAATAQNRQLLEAINRGGRYASGGYIGAQRVEVAQGQMSSRDVGRIVAMLRETRPLYGTVNVHGDGSFERDARLRAAAEGV